MEKKHGEKPSERRQRYRLKTGIKALVKFGDRSEIASVENITKTGLYFQGAEDYRPGSSLRVICPYDPTKPSQNKPQWAEVVRVVEVKDSIKKGVAAKLLDLFLKP